MLKLSIGGFGDDCGRYRMRFH